MSPERLRRLRSELDERMRARQFSGALTSALLLRTELEAAVRDAGSDALELLEDAQHHIEAALAQARSIRGGLVREFTELGALQRYLEFSGRRSGVDTDSFLA